MEVTQSILSIVTRQMEQRLSRIEEENSRQLSDLADMNEKVNIMYKKLPANSFEFREGSLSFNSMVGSVFEYFKQF